MARFALLRHGPTAWTAEHRLQGQFDLPLSPEGRWAVARCKERGCGMVQLTSNKKRLAAHRFYERLGFAKSHEGFKLYL